MKKITILLLLMCFLSEFIFAQTYPGTPVSNPVRTYTQNDTKGVWVIGNGAPIFSPTAKMSQLYFDYIGQKPYFWNGSAWVDWSAGYIISASNGLTETTGTVKLGGSLIEETTIDLDGNDLIIEGTGGFAIDVTSNIQLQTAGTIDLLADGKLQTFTLANMEVYAAQDIAIETDDVINIHSINGGSIIVDNNDFVLTATAGDVQINSPGTTAGVVNGIAYKADIANSVAVTDYGVNTTTAGVPDDGKVWTYNSTTNEMELQTLPSAIPGLNTIGSNQLTSGLRDSIVLNNWHTLGNAGTSATTNFIGTTDSVSFTIKAYNKRAARVYADDNKWVFGLGNGNGTDGNNAVILDRTVDSTLAENHHGFADATIFKKTTNGRAYASFDTQLMSYDGTANYDHYASFQAGLNHRTSGLTSAVYGLYSFLDIEAGSVGSRYGLFVADATGAGTLTTNYGIKVNNLTKGATNYSIHTGAAQTLLGSLTGTGGRLVLADATGILSAPTSGAIRIGTGTGTTEGPYFERGGFGGMAISTYYESATNWGVSLGAPSTYGTSAYNFFILNCKGGRVGIGASVPTASLHIKAGTAGASSAPIKLTSGTLNTSPEVGAIEFLTDAFYGTITTGAARKTFAFLESPTFTGTVTVPALAYNATTWNGNNTAPTRDDIRDKIEAIAPIAGSFSGTGTATTTFTVTIGSTMTNTTYKVNATPSNVLSAAVFYVNNKTTTTFDVVYLAGLTGTVEFDWSVFP